MTIDRNAAPTNKLLLERGPEGIIQDSRVRRRTKEWIEMPIHETTDDGEWFLHLAPLRADVRDVWLVCVAAMDDYYGGDLPIGNVATAGEVIDLYEHLSQKKWPGNAP